MIFLFLVLPAVIMVEGSSIGAVPLPQNVESIDPSRIIGGQKAPAKDVLHMVSLQYIPHDDKPPIDRRDYHFCGGSIVNEFYIVTAGHCIYKKKATDFQVFMGSPNLNKGGKFVKVEKLIAHEKYVHASLSYDIAVVKVHEKIVMSPTIQPVKMDTKKIGVKPVKAYGWGYWTYPNLTLPEDAQVVSMVTMDEATCKKKFGVGPTKICTKEDKGHGTCMGDSGSCLMGADGMVGTTSGGDPCANGKKPDLFMRVSEMHSWISTNTKVK